LETVPTGGTGENRFRDAEDWCRRGWSRTAYGFVAGVLRHAPALAAICTPTVDSFKRLQPRLTDGTVSWAPVCAGYGDNNRSCMLRLPRNRPCVKNRGGDGLGPVDLHETVTTKRHWGSSCPHGHRPTPRPQRRQ
jgi:glutamine synthetase